MSIKHRLLYNNLHAAATAQDIDVISGATANSIYVLDNTAVQTGYAVKGGIYGLSDTLITAIPTTAPANSAKVTGMTAVTLSWPAVTGANNYYVTLNGVEEQWCSSRKRYPYLHCSG